MPKWRVAWSCPAEQSLPPTDLTTTLTLSKSNKPVAKYMVDTPTNEFGLPDTERLLHDSAATVHREYEWPDTTNVHHLAYPRVSYHSSPELKEYRENTMRKVRIPIQFHNYIHKTTLPPPTPSMDVIHRCLIEQRRIDMLFAQGRQAIRFAKWAEEFKDSMIYESDYYKMRSHYAAENYHRLLDRCDESQLGIGLDLEHLHTLPLDAATTELGRLAACQALDFRHESQRLVQRYGFN